MIIPYNLPASGGESNLAIAFGARHIPSENIKTLYFCGYGII